MDYCFSTFINTLLFSTRPDVFLLAIPESCSFRFWFNLPNSIHSPIRPLNTVLRPTVSISPFIILDCCGEISRITWSPRIWGNTYEPAPHILKSNRFKLSDFVSRTKTCRFLEGYSPSKINRRRVSFQGRNDLRIHYHPKRPFFAKTFPGSTLIPRMSWL